MMLFMFILFVCVSMMLLTILLCGGGGWGGEMLRPTLIAWS
jgi:hypothetical protein